MAVLKQKDLSTYPTSGAATTVTTTFDSISGGTHFGSADVPSGATGANGYIVGAEGAALSFGYDPNTGVPTPFTGAPADGMIYTAVFWLYADVTTPASLAFAYASSSNSYASTPSVSFLSSPVVDAAQPESGSGYIFIPFTGAAANIICASGSGYVRQMDGTVALTTGTLIRPNMPVNRWVAAWARITLGASGLYEFGIGNQILGSAIVDTTGMSTTQKNTFTMTLPATPGITWRLIPDPNASWRQASTAVAGHPVIITQGWSPSNYLVAAHNTQTFLDGRDGSNGTLAGTATSTAIRPYCPLNSLDATSERVLFKLNSGQAETLTRDRDLGTLPYNEDGWCWIVQKDVVIRGDATGYWWIKNTAGTLVASIYWNYSIGKFTLGTGLTGASSTPDLNRVVGAMPPSGASTTLTGAVVDLAVAFNSDGRMWYAVFDRSNNPSPTLYDGQNIVCKRPSTWTPADIGDRVIGAGAFTTTNIFTIAEIGAEVVARYLPVVGTDSWTEATQYLTGFDYIEWSGGAATVAVTNTLDGLGFSGLTVVACSNAQRWAVLYSNSSPNWPASSTLNVSSGSTITGVTAARKLQWIDATVSSGTPTRGDTYTETTLGTAPNILGRLCMSGALDVAYGIPANTYGFGGVALTALSGTPALFRGAANLVSGGTACTLAAGTNQPGYYRSCTANGATSRAYNCLQDAYGASVLSPFPSSIGGTGAASKTIQYVLPFGRAGKYASLVGPGYAGMGGLPAIFLDIHEGVVNFLVGATTAELADSIAQREVNATMRLIDSVADNDGLVLVRRPTFNASGSYGFNAAFASTCWAQYWSLLVNAISRSNRLARISIVDNGTSFWASTDGAHPNATGRSDFANASSQNAKLGPSQTGRKRILPIAN